MQSVRKDTFEPELPEGYTLIRTIDAKEKKTSTRFTVGALIIMAIGLILCVCIYRPSFDEIFSWRYAVAIGVMLAYIVLHELTHGIAYKLLTGRKLVFGMTLTVAYCGVPDIFVYRKTALISLLAPFTVFGILFLLGLCLLPEAIDRFYSALLLSFHLSGCVGDLYDAWLFMTRLRDPKILMQDTGPKQNFYGKAEKE